MFYWNQPQVDMRKWFKNGPSGMNISFHYAFLALEWRWVSITLNFMIKVVWEGCFCHVSVSAPINKLRNHNQWGDGKITLLPMINKCLPSPWLINIILEVKTVVTICEDKHRELRKIFFVNPEFLSPFHRNGGGRKWLICCSSKVCFKSLYYVVNVKSHNLPGGLSAQRMVHLICRQWKALEQGEYFIHSYLVCDLLFLK